MLISFLVGYVICHAIVSMIVEISIRIVNYWNARQEIRQKASERIGKPISFLEVINKFPQEHDEEVMEVKAFDAHNNVIAKINVTAENRTLLKVGQRF